MPSRFPGWPAVLAMMLLTVVRAAGAQQPPPLELTRLTEPIVLDGMPDEAAWQRIPLLPLTVYAPVFRAPPKQRSEIRVAYDDEFFYAAGWFYDDDCSSRLAVRASAPRLPAR